ncbi:zinc finger, CCHC-type containing protein [Tanacetum coccineum]
MDEAIRVSCIIDKLPPSWKDFKHTLKHKKEELTLVELGSHLRIEESLRAQDSDKPKGNNVVGPQAVVRLPDPKLKTLGERGIECIFVGYAEHSKAFRFYVIEPNDSVSINSIIESRDAIFDENRFSSVPRPSLRIPNGTEDIGGSVVPEEVTEEVVQQPEPELRKSKRNRTPKDFGPKFQLYLIEGTRDEVSDQHSYCFNVEDDPKTFDEAMKSQDVAFWKEAINDEMDSIMGNNTWVLADLPPGCKPLGCKWIFKRKLKVDETIEKFKARLVIQGFKQKSMIDYFDTYALFGTYQYHKTADCYGVNSQSDYSSDGCEDSFLECKGVIICLYVDDMLIFGTDQVQVDLAKEFLSSRFSMKDMGEANIILGIRIKHESNGIAISQSHYIKKVLKKFNYFDCTPVSTPMDKSEKLMPNNGQHWQAIQRVPKYLKKIMDYRLTYSWLSFNVGSGLPRNKLASSGSTIGSGICALAVVAYSQMCNGKSRHLGVRHSMIRELITNGVISIEFVRSQQTLVITDNGTRL